MAQQLVTSGVVTGFVPGKPDYAIISNGPYQVFAYIAGPSGNIKVGQTYQVYKVENTYYVGTEVPSR